MGRDRPLGPERAAVDIVEAAPIPFTFTLKPPPPLLNLSVRPAGDFPWLGPLPGWQFRQQRSRTPNPFRVAITGVTEPELVAPSSDHQNLPTAPGWHVRQPLSRGLSRCPHQSRLDDPVRPPERFPHRALHSERAQPGGPPCTRANSTRSV